MNRNLILALAVGIVLNCICIFAWGEGGNEKPKIGLHPSFSGSYLAGKALLLARADLVLDNQLMPGNNYRVGLGVASGNDKDNLSLKTGLMFFEGIFNFSRKASWGGKNYIGAGFNYSLYGTDRKAGAMGYRLFAGSEGDAGFGGITFVEIAYALVRAGDINKRSAEGIEMVLGQKMDL